MRNIAPILLVAVACIALSGCEFAALDVAAVEGEAAALDSMGMETAAARLTPLESAAAGGTLERALAELTADGTQTAVLTVTDDGIISTGPRGFGRNLALLNEQGQIYSATMPSRQVGYLSNGWLYEINQAGDRAVAELHGFVPSEGVDLSPDGEVHILRSRVYVDVLQIRDGRYLVRLANGREFWIDGALAVLLVGSQQHNECPNGSGVVVRKSGEVIPFDSCSETNGVYTLSTPDGQVLVDASDVQSILEGAAEGIARNRSVQLTGQQTVYGESSTDGAVTHVATDEGEILVDNRRLASFGVAAPPVRAIGGQSQTNPSGQPLDDSAPPWDGQT